MSTRTKSRGPRVICYYTKHHIRRHDRSWLVPSISPGSGVTHVIIGDMRLSDSVLSVARSEDENTSAGLIPLWDIVRHLQEHGVKVLASLDDAAGGALCQMKGDLNDHEFKSTVRQIITWLVEHTFDGVELTIGQALSLQDAITLIVTLRAELGNSFIITIGTTATHLLGIPEWSKIDCKLLEASIGEHIAWYNVQFLGRNDILFDITEYQEIVSNDWPAEKLVVRIGAGSGSTPPSISVPALKLLLAALSAQYASGFGGITAWESTTPNLELTPTERVSRVAKIVRDHFTPSIDNEASSERPLRPQPSKKSTREPPAKDKHSKMLKEVGMDVDHTTTEVIKITCDHSSPSHDIAAPGTNDILAYHLLSARQLGPKLKCIGSTVTDEATKKLINKMYRDR